MPANNNFYYRYYYRSQLKSESDMYNIDHGA